MTCSQQGVYRPNPLYPTLAKMLYGSAFLTQLLQTSEPKGFKSTIKSPAWVEAMEEEIHALSKNGTWELVPRPSCVDVVRSKWVYRTKFNANGYVDRLKARLAT